MPKQLPKTYNPLQVEDKIYKKWEESGFFNPDVCVKKGVCAKGAESFTIVLPPPNATGSLHIGHAMMLAIEDLMIRYHRMKGDKTLWIPGTDHAAIATNAIVERQLVKEGKTKYDLGREAYIERVKDYIAQSQDNIRRQIRKMGSSLDWSREAYTWDEQRNLAVRTMFKKMYDDELIYRGNRIVNWCPHCHSTLADDEVEYREENGKFYWIKYGPFILATARPETKLGDTAVAVHPKDERYKKMVGKKYMIPGVLGEFEITVVADEAVDPEFGSGAVKVTPAHSFADAEIAQHHGIRAKQIINEDGKMMKNCGKYAGMTTREAREAIVADMKKMGLIDHTEDNYKHNLSICYRCKNIIEPLPSKQWFIDVNKKFKLQNSKIDGIKNGQEVTLKELMQTVVSSGQIKIIPRRFDKIYFNWIDNLRDWCISRQIWVGHQIPVWYRGEEIYVDVNPPKGNRWKQDPDTLDTWFSSGLWTFSTLGWPNETEDLKIFHPTSVLETMFDILFFWVARMIMMTTYALGEIPFETVYLHARVLDRDGEKMSKSKQETMIDPLDVCRKYGTDAVRLSLLLGIAPGADVRLSEEKIAGFRNFTNKLWNIARFIIANSKIPAKSGTGKNQKLTLSDQWILLRFRIISEVVTDELNNFRFSHAGEALREFTWGELADWYLEISKIEKNKDAILIYILENLLKLWHPFMPFVTEQIWKEMGMKDILMVSSWPEVDRSKGDALVLKRFKVIQDIITSIRNARSEFRVPPAKKLKLVIKTAGETTSPRLLKENEAVIKALARLGSIEFGAKPDGAVVLVVGAVELYLDLGGIIDIEKEQKRIKSEIDNLEKYIKGLDKKLLNKEFVKKAPKEIVEEERRKLSETEEKLNKLNAQLKSLK